MIKMLARIFLISFVTWLVAGAICWVGGSYFFAYFNHKQYSVSLADIKPVINLSLIVSLAYTFFAWVNAGRK